MKLSTVVRITIAIALGRLLFNLAIIALMIGSLLALGYFSK